MNKQELQDRAVKIYKFRDQPHKYIYEVMVQVPHATNMFAFPTPTTKYYLLDGSNITEMKQGDRMMSYNDGGTREIELDGIGLTIPHDRPGFGCSFTLSYGMDQLLVI
jgi:hypothetical protein